MIRLDNFYDAKLPVLAAQRRESMGFVPRWANPDYARSL
jgi:hypothetical protein